MLEYAIDVATTLKTWSPLALGLTNAQTSLVSQK